MGDFKLMNPSLEDLISRSKKTLKKNFRMLADILRRELNG